MIGATDITCGSTSGVALNALPGYRPGLNARSRDSSICERLGDVCARTRDKQATTPSGLL